MGVGIAEADVALDEHIKSYREPYKRVRPHEAIGLVATMVRYLAEPREPAHE